MNEWSDNPEKDKAELHRIIDEASADHDENNLEGWRGKLSFVFDWLRETSFILGMAVLLSVLLRTFVFQAFFVPSESMENTLLTDDRIIASKLSYRFGDIHRGDIVVFHDPSDWLYTAPKEPGLHQTINDVMTWIGILPSNSGDDLVKRVIGLPGDKVACCSKDGHITINGLAIDETSYIRDETNQIPFSITVPEGRVFVMGDNRGASSDSRFHLDEASGTVPIENIVGQVTFRVWPMNRFAKMNAPDVFSQVS
ncbi:MAG: signal peptidase [Actinomycetota bacterium]